MSEKPSEIAYHAVIHHLAFIFFSLSPSLTLSTAIDITHTTHAIIAIIVPATTILTNVTFISLPTMEFINVFSIFGLKYWKIVTSESFLLFLNQNQKDSTFGFYNFWLTLTIPYLNIPDYTLPHHTQPNHT